MPTQHPGTLNRLFRMAVVAGVESAVKIHIQRGDDLNARDGNGRTPLMLAAMRNKPAVCVLLLSSGADLTLEAPDGNDALAHARLAGADAAIQAINAAIHLPHRKNPRSSTLEGQTPAARSPPEPERIDRAAGSLAPPGFMAIPAPDQESTPGLSGIPKIVGMNGLRDSTLDQANAFTESTECALSPHVSNDQPADQITDWEPEVEPQHGGDDPILAAGAATVQIAISNYTPFDSSTDWDDLEVYLPITSTPLRGVDDPESKASLRLLLLRAIREGSVPDMAVVNAATNADRSKNGESEALLRMIISDLGAETDERFEYSAANDQFEVVTQPEESAEEEDAISEAVAFIDAHEANRHDPLRMYQREFQRGKLITADEEVSIARKMEGAVSKAIDALAKWPQGMVHLASCAEMVKTGAKPIRWLSNGARDEAPEDIDKTERSEAILVIPEMDEPDSESGFEHEEHPVESEAIAFFDRLATLSKLAKHPGSSDSNDSDARATLVSLSLKSSFLLGMVDHARGDRSAQAALFASAMGGYQQSRDRMATANLKLVASIANKFLYTGMPLEDLIQEGNVGLLNAVEKYDWRKGFRFSTYATWWIRQRMYRAAADTSRTIRLPVHMFEIVQRVLRASLVFERANGRAPTQNEIAEILSLPINKAAVFMRIAQDTVPIDAEAIDDLISPSSIPEFSTPDPFDVVAASDLQRVIAGMLDEMDRKDSRILRMRFGIGVPDAMTLNEIAIQYGVTRERIRQIESNVLRKFKHPSRADKLLGLMDQVRSLTPPARQVDQNLIDDDFDQEIGDSPASPTITGSNRPAATVRDIVTKKPTRHHSTFHRLMTQALEMGVDVTMDRESASGTTWVNIKEAPDNRQRKLIRKLLAIGFKHWPGKGYWR